MEPIVPIVVSLVTAVGTIVGASIAVRQARKKEDANAAATITDTALDLIQPLRAELAELRTSVRAMDMEIEILKRENHLLHKWAQMLYAQVVEFGGDPVSFGWVKDRFPDA